MTWLPTPDTGSTERDAVLGLHPRAYARHRAFLHTCDALVDPDLLELCRARMAQMLRCREELARHDPGLLSTLGSWYEAEAFTDLQRNALEFVEQFLVDPSQLTRELVAALERDLGTSGVIDFTHILATYEASLRLSALFDLEPAS